MSDVKVIQLTTKQVVEAMLKQQGITNGIWGLWVEFGIGAANVPGPTGIVSPTALVPITKLGLQSMSQVTDISVDASSIASLEARPKKTGRKKKGSIA